MFQDMMLCALPACYSHQQVKLDCFVVPVVTVRNIVAPQTGRQIMRENIGAQV